MSEINSHSIDLNSLCTLGKVLILIVNVNVNVNVGMLTLLLW